MRSMSSRARWSSRLAAAWLWGVTGAAWTGLGSRSPAWMAARVWSPFSCHRRRMPFI